MEAERYPKTTACLRFEAELEAYLEGENRPFITGHSRECTFCRVVLADLEEIASAARNLPLEEPSPAVWANVRAHLEAEGIIRQP